MSPLNPDRVELELRGYSERGMVNTLLHEIRYGTHPIEKLRGVLGLCEFPDPHQRPDFTLFRAAKVRVEQSFSDFGDLDVFVLLDGPSRQSVFIEAKVKTFQTRQWRIAAEWTAFTEMLRKRELPGSNLFVQLYRKMQLVRKAPSPNAVIPPDGVAQRWSLGENGVVQRAAAELAPYCGEPWFVALVPDTRENVETCYSEADRYRHKELPSWGTERWGYMLWRDLETYCRRSPTDWPETLAGFEYNQGQIFDDGPTGPGTPDRPPPPGSAVTWTDGPHGPVKAVVVRRGTHRTRVRLTDGREVVVPHGELEWAR